MASQSFFWYESDYIFTIYTLHILCSIVGVIFDHEAGERIRLVASVRLFVSSPVSALKLEMFYHCKSMVCVSVIN